MGSMSLKFLTAQSPKLRLKFLQKALLRVSGRVGANCSELGSFIREGCSTVTPLEAVIALLCRTPLQLEWFLKDYIRFKHKSKGG